MTNVTERKKSDRALVADLDDDGVHLSKLQEQQALKAIEDTFLDILNAITSLSSVADRLLDKCRSFTQQSVDVSNDQPDQKVWHPTEAIESLEESIAELNLLQSQAKSQLKKAQGARAMVCTDTSINPDLSITDLSR